VGSGAPVDWCSHPHSHPTRLGHHPPTLRPIDAHRSLSVITCCHREAQSPKARLQHLAMAQVAGNIHLGTL
jgi:hypothetical protein